MLLFLALRFNTANTRAECWRSLKYEGLPSAATHADTASRAVAEEGRHI